MSRADLLADLREAIGRGLDSEPEELEVSLSERIAERLRDLVWPERHVELKKMKAMKELEKEAESG